MKKIIDALKIFMSFLISCIIKKYKCYWLICERGDDARDNGYFFFKYIRETYPDIKIIYAINSKSVDLNKIKDCGETVEYGSIKHGIIYFSCKYLISSHPNLCKPNWCGMYAFEKIKIFPKGKRIFLQHGVIKDKLEDLMANKFKVDLFICGAKPEYAYIKNNYGFKDEIVKYTGLARFDTLHKNKKEKMILVMPTWRNYYKDLDDSEFINTEYYNKYMELLNSDEIAELLKKYEYEMVFYPHYETQKKIHLFKKSCENIKIADFNNYDVQTLLMKCDFLITDYSSVFFDVAYMRKRVIFYQFDYEIYRSKHYKEGYFDYNDSFGPVANCFEELRKMIEKYTENDDIEEKYKKNQEKYFELYDTKNCERILDEILKLEEK